MFRLNIVFELLDAILKVRIQSLLRRLNLIKKPVSPEQYALCSVFKSTIDLKIRARHFLFPNIAPIRLPFAKCGYNGILVIE